MMHIDERRIALMASEFVGSDVLVSCYFSNDDRKLLECLESKLGKEATSSFLGKTAINLRTGNMFPDIQRTVLEYASLETNKFDLNIDYSKQVVEMVEPTLEMEGRVR